MGAGRPTAASTSSAIPKFQVISANALHAPQHSVYAPPQNSAGKAWHPATRTLNQYPSTHCVTVLHVGNTLGTRCEQVEVKLCPLEMCVAGPRTRSNEIESIWRLRAESDPDNFSPTVAYPYIHAILVSGTVEKTAEWSVWGLYRVEYIDMDS